MQSLHSSLKPSRSSRTSSIDDTPCLGISTKCVISTLHIINNFTAFPQHAVNSRNPHLVRLTSRSMERNMPTPAKADTASTTACV
ncbi:hypothetical protein CEP54_015520 [Fusarium duplospermum]|uniref:Uncharacterized protein n=1 Tax=Fusarium duplospermum TaxID=1325734 RepID=A0A428NNF4_9HYPO|nr:hypothetical protein CEP54_015520 [Fusarium duplospermum]